MVLAVTEIFVVVCMYIQLLKYPIPPPPPLSQKFVCNGSRRRAHPLWVSPKEERLLLDSRCCLVKPIVNGCCVGHTAWGPEGREGCYQAGPKGAFGKIRPPPSAPPRRKMKNPPFFREKGRRFLVVHLSRKKGGKYPKSAPKNNWPPPHRRKKFNK